MSAMCVENTSSRVKDWGDISVPFPAIAATENSHPNTTKETMRKLTLKFISSVITVRKHLKLNNLLNNM